MKWQPIETAPTDGTRILLRGRNGKIADGHYGQPDGFANPKRFVWPYINATPTHWAPLALIDAAPELLAAARKVNALSIQTDAHKELRAAISKPTARQREPKSGIPRPPAAGFQFLGVLIGENT